MNPHHTSATLASLKGTPYIAVRTSTHHLLQRKIRDAIANNDQARVRRLEAMIEVMFDVEVMWDNSGKDTRKRASYHPRGPGWPEDEDGEDYVSILNDVYFMIDLVIFYKKQVLFDIRIFKGSMESIRNTILHEWSHCVDR